MSASLLFIGYQDKKFGRVAEVIRTWKSLPVKITILLMLWCLIVERSRWFSCCRTWIISIFPYFIPRTVVMLVSILQNCMLKMCSCQHFFIMLYDTVRKSCFYNIILHLQIEEILFVCCDVHTFFSIFAWRREKHTWLLVVHELMRISKICSVASGFRFPCWLHLPCCWKSWFQYWFDCSEGRVCTWGGQKKLPDGPSSCTKS